MKTSPITAILVAGLVVLAGCIAPIQPQYTLSSVTATPTAAIPFDQWLSGSGYTVFTDISDGGKHYSRPNQDFTISIYTDTVVAWNTVSTQTAAAKALDEATIAAIAAIEAHGLDAQPVRAAFISPFTLPLTLHGTGYLFVLQDMRQGGRFVVSAQVTFVDP